MAKKNLGKAKAQLKRFQVQGKLELARHMRALKLAAKRYRVALKKS